VRRRRARTAREMARVIVFGLWIIVQPLENKVVGSIVADWGGDGNRIDGRVGLAWRGGWRESQRDEGHKGNAKGAREYESMRV
jgi:hypothetical protein